MNRFVIAVATLLFACACATGQESTTADTLGSAPPDTLGWETGGKVGVNVSQVAHSNWAGGGRNTLTITGLASLFGNFRHMGGSWDNTLETGYGFTKQAEEDARKSDDRLIYVSRYGYNASEQFLYSALLDFRTQLTDGFDYGVFDTSANGYPVISRPFAPATLKVGIGMTYKPAPFFEVLLAPVSNQHTIVLDDELSSVGAFGVEPGKKFKSELGSLLNVLYNQDVMENVSVRSRFNAFAPYDRFTTAVITWESLVNLKVNDYVNASIAVDVLYDENVTIARDDGTTGPATQLREVLAIGLGVSF